jgi:hypothetical protein
MYFWNPCYANILVDNGCIGVHIPITEANTVNEKNRLMSLARW